MPLAISERRLTPMDYHAFTNDSLTMMYESIRGALHSDDVQTAQGDEPRFRVRATPAWKEHAGNLEAEMLRRGMLFEIIDWAEANGQRRGHRIEIPVAGAFS